MEFFISTTPSSPANEWTIAESADNQYLQKLPPISSHIELALLINTQIKQLYQYNFLHNDNNNSKRPHIYDYDILHKKLPFLPPTNGLHKFLRPHLSTEKIHEIILKKFSSTIVYIGPTTAKEKTPAKYTEKTGRLEIDFLSRVLLIKEIDKNSTSEHSLEIKFEDIREIRAGNGLSPHDVKKEPVSIYPKNLCFSLHFGNEFNLNHLTVRCNETGICELWMHCISLLSLESINMPTQEKMQVFYSRNSKFEDLKIFCAKNNFRTQNQNNILKEIEDNGSKNVELIYKKLLEEQDNLIFKFLKRIFKKSFENDEINLENYLHDKWKINELEFDCLKLKPKPDISELISVLFCWEFSIWDSNKLSIHNLKYQENLEKKSISDYFIYSSHNTYLTADQLRGNSSVECYARTLHMGTRCIELDCWDGDDGMPIIYHGWTLTSKIKFYDVIQIINELAFLVTDLPLILSIENHCSFDQQAYMATIMKDVFKGKLLLEPVDVEEKALPPLSALKNKILIKWKSGKKIQTDKLEDTVYDARAKFNEDVYDIKISVTKRVLMFSKIEEENEDCCYLAGDEHSHLDKPWFHGNIEKSSLRSLLANQVGHFLIRPSRTKPNKFSLDVRNVNLKIVHILIHTKKDDNENCIFYIDQKWSFDNLQALVQHYQKNNLTGNLKLTSHAINSFCHKNANWYHTNDISKNQAETILVKNGVINDYLVREDEDEIKLSILVTPKMIKHLKGIGPHYTNTGNIIFRGLDSDFNTLEEMLDYHESYSLNSDGLILGNRITQAKILELMDKLDKASGKVTNYVVIYDYKSSGNDNMLTLKRGQILQEVKKETKNIWSGKLLNSYETGKFSPNYVKPIVQTTLKHRIITNSVIPIDPINIRSIENQCAVSLEVNNSTSFEWELMPAGDNNLPVNLYFDNILQQEEFVNNCMSIHRTQIDYYEPNSVQATPQENRSLQSFGSALTEYTEEVSLNENKKVAKTNRINPALSGLVVYCRAVHYGSAVDFRDMSSLGETSFLNKISKYRK